MYATINIPGSSHFEYYGPATKAACQKWLTERVEELLETEVLSSLLPQRIVSNKLAESWKYLDGSRVVTPEDNPLYETRKASLPCGCPPDGHVKSCPGYGL